MDYTAISHADWLVLVLTTLLVYSPHMPFALSIRKEFFRASFDSLNLRFGLLHSINTSDLQYTMWAIC